MLNASLLIVDDDKNQAETLRRVLALEGFHATTVFSPQDALNEISRRVPDAIISDYRMGEMTGMDLFLEVRERHPEVLFVLVTAYGSLETAVSALKAGVYDFITKPVDTDELVIKLKKALDYKNLASENVELREKIAQLSKPITIIGQSEAMNEVLERVEKVAESNATVLVHGESGTGKELIARSLHYKSRRFEGPYIKVNCAAIPENLLEDELFGHEAGAFTGATGLRKGKFEAAHNGSIFLDEIGEMPLHLQTKFLRVLQERDFERIGGNETISVDVRVIAATNRDLPLMAREGEFREDLFYRLNVIPIHLPPLRERMDDVLPLATYFLARFCEKNGRELGEASSSVEEKLMSYSWPGNVRELENCLERAVVLAKGDTLDPEDLVFSGEERGSAIHSVLDQLMTTDLSIDELGRRLVLSALERCGGNVSQTARCLGLTRRTLQYRIEKIRGGEDEDDSKGDEE